MSEFEKINYLRIAAGIAGFSIKIKHLALLVRLYELVLEKKGDAALSEIAEIEDQVLRDWDRLVKE